MVIIDEHDVGKTPKQVLMDLIYEAFGERIPIDKVRFGKPREVDVRKDLWSDPNTFISARVDPAYDSRYNTAGSGFMYRRRNITHHCRVYDFSSVAPTSLPFKVSDILDQINKAMQYPLQLTDLVNREYKTLEEVKAGVKLVAHEDSLLWIGKHIFQPDTSFLEGEEILDVLELDGFHYYNGLAPSGDQNPDPEIPVDPPVDPEHGPRPLRQTAYFEIDPLAAYTQFGYTVAINADGDMFAVGASGTDNNEIPLAGTVYIYQKIDGLWQHTQTLVASDAERFGSFGNSVAMSADGKTLVVGSSGRIVDGFLNVGRAYIYTHNGSVWVEKQVITKDNSYRGGYFGHSVSANADGSVIAISTIRSPFGARNGRVFIYKSNDSVVWSESAVVACSVDYSASFGYSCALDAGGTTLVAGAPHQYNADVDLICGAAYVFKESDGVWVESAILERNDITIEQYFGRAVAIAGDGSQVFIGAPEDNDENEKYNGAVYVYKNSEGKWPLIQKLIPQTTDDGVLFGECMSISGDSQRLVVGAITETTYSYSDDGRIYSYSVEPESGQWILKPEHEPVPQNPVHSRLGQGLALSHSGDCLIAGAVATEATTGGVQGEVGRVFVFEGMDATPT